MAVTDSGDESLEGPLGERFDHFGPESDERCDPFHQQFAGEPQLGAGIASLDESHGRRRVLFVSSSGGHLSQLLQLRPWWVHHDRQWVTFDLPDARSKLEGETLIPAYHPTTRNVVNMVRNTPLAYRVIRRFRPDVVISNGAGVAFPFFGVAKLLGIPTVYLEVYDRIDSKTLTGRLCAPLSSLFLVQWPEQRALYDGSALVGPLY